MLEGCREWKLEASIALPAMRIPTSSSVHIIILIIKWLLRTPPTSDMPPSMRTLAMYSDPEAEGQAPSDYAGSAFRQWRLPDGGPHRARYSLQQSTVATTSDRLTGTHCQTPRTLVDDFSYLFIPVHIIIEREHGDLAITMREMTDYHPSKP